MKKSILFIALVMLVGSAFAQLKKDRTSAYNYWMKKDFVKAKEYIEKAIAYPEAATDAKVWFYRANIYYDIQANGMSALLEPNSVNIAYESFKKASELDVKGEYKSDIASRISGIGGEFFNSGLALFKEEKYQEALSFFDKAISISKENQSIDTMAYYASGLCNKALYTKETPEKLDAAITRYQYLVDINFKMIDLYVDLANIYSVKGDYSKGRAVIEKARSFFPTDAGLTIADANLDLQEKKYANAIEKLKVAAALESGNAGLQHAMGVSYGEMRNDPTISAELKETYFQEAVKSYTKALEIDPKMFDAAFNVGVLFFNRGGDVVNEANKLPITETAKYDAMITEGKDYLTRALPFLEKCAELSPTDHDTLISLKEIYTRLNMSEKLNALNEKLK